MKNTLDLLYKHYIQSLLRSSGILTITKFYYKYHLVNNFEFLVVILLQIEVSSKSFNLIYNLLSCIFDL